MLPPFVGCLVVFPCASCLVVFRVTTICSVFGVFPCYHHLQAIIYVSSVLALCLVFSHVITVFVFAVNSYCLYCASSFIYDQPFIDIKYFTLPVIQSTVHTCDDAGIRLFSAVPLRLMLETRSKRS